MESIRALWSSAGLFSLRRTLTFSPWGEYWPFLPEEKNHGCFSLKRRTMTFSPWGESPVLRCHLGDPISFHSSNCLLLNDRSYPGIFSELLLGVSVWFLKSPPSLHVLPLLDMPPSTQLLSQTFGNSPLIPPPASPPHSLSSMPWSHHFSPHLL